MRAEVNYADPSTRSFAGWAGIMAGLALGVAIIVGAMAWMARNRAPIKRASAAKAPAMKSPVTRPDPENPKNTTK